MRRWVLARTYLLSSGGGGVPADVADGTAEAVDAPEGAELLADVPRLAGIPADAAGRSWRCTLCSVWTFATARALATHVMVWHRRRGIYVCGACDGRQLFSSHGRVVAHGVAAHGVDARAVWGSAGVFEVDPPPERKVKSDGDG